MGGKRLSLADQNEEIVKEYFEGRGWSADKLDGPGRSDRDEAVDWRICHHHSGYCFLCEVKTISSARANIPYGPIKDYMRGKRDKEKALLDNYKRAHPDTHLLVTPEEHEFLHGGEGWFNKKYQYVSRSTEVYFRKFVKKVKSHLRSSSMSNLPYIVRFDSDDLYAPTKEEHDTFVKWLEAELPRIHQGTPSRYWNIVPKGAGSSGLYSAFYPIHKSKSDTDIDRRIQVTVVGPGKGNNLEVEVHCYGTFNLDAITRNVEKASGQLESSASKEHNGKIPRVVVLALETGITAQMALDWQELVEPHLAWLLEKYPNLSALAVLEMVPDGTPPPQEEGFSAWLKFQLKAPRVARFIVYHSSWLCGVEPLDPKVFSDNRSVQFRYVDGNWQA